MDHRPPPTTDFMATLVRVSRREREPRWHSGDGKRIYVWDGLHGELESYDRRGSHLGVVDPLTGRMIKAAVRGRTIDV